MAGRTVGRTVGRAVGRTVGRTASQVTHRGAHRVTMATVTRASAFEFSGKSSLQSSLQSCAGRRGRRISAGSSPEDTPMDVEAGVPDALGAGEDVVGARADDGPTAVPAPASTGKIDALTILKGLVDVVRRHGRALVAIYLVTEAVNFLTNRAFHRLTNQIAMTSLAVPEEAIGNVWWLSQVGVRASIVSCTVRWPWIAPSLATSLLLTFSLSVHDRRTQSCWPTGRRTRP